MELLAPAGDTSCLKAALYVGADAIYFGVGRFNARVKADGFDTDNVRESIRLCHLFGVKAYVTFNTAVKQTELDEMFACAKICADADADAFIVTDVGAVKLLRTLGVPLHASTQMGIHNALGAAAVKDLGCERIIVSRETSLEDIVEIKKLGLEVEYFVQGALCVGFSGGCLLSAMAGGESGNRGRCNQLCRLPYESSLGTSGYLLSTSDLCLIDRLDALREVGVDSIKIEGRLKKANYIYAAVRAYRGALDRGAATSDEVADIRRAFNRGGFTRGYAFEETDKLMSIKMQGNAGEKIGVVIADGVGEVTIRTEETLENGDGIKLVRNGRELCGFGVTVVGRTRNITRIKAPDVRQNLIGADVCLTLDKSRLDYAAALQPMIGIMIAFELDDDGRATLTFKSDKCKVKTIKTVDARAAESGVCDVKKYLVRLGGTHFECVDCKLTGCDGMFIPPSQLNAMRRESVKALEEALLEANAPRRLAVSESSVCKTQSDKTFKPFVEVVGVNVLDAELLEKCNIVLSWGENGSENVLDILKSPLFENNDNKVYLRPPRIARGADIKNVEDTVSAIYERGKLRGMICDNAYVVALSKKYGIEIVGGLGLNICNGLSGSEWGLDRVMASAEVNREELSECGADIVFAFGPLPVMTLTHCPIKLNTSCECAKCAYPKGGIEYRDRKFTYKIRRVKSTHCYFEMYNPQIVDIRRKLENTACTLYYNMVEYNRNQIKAVLEGENIGETSTIGRFVAGVK